MARQDAKEHKNPAETNPADRAGDTHSGTPNAVDPNEVKSTEHKSGYGGEGGKPRTSSDKRKPEPG